MEILSIENRTAIEDELKRLGFANHTQIVNSFTETPELSTTNGKVAQMDDIGKDKQGIDYMFRMVKPAGTEDWKLQTVQAYLSMETARNVEGGYIIVGKSYNLDKVALPTKEQIDKEILVQVNIEKANDIFFLYPKLHNDFQRLGFGNDESRVMLEIPFVSFKFISIKESVDFLGRSKLEHIDFVIASTTGDLPNSAEIISISATLYKESEKEKSVQKVEKLEFNIKDGPLPTKDEILYMYYLKASESQELKNSGNLSQNKKASADETTEVSRIKSIKDQFGLNGNTDDFRTRQDSNAGKGLKR